MRIARMDPREHRMIPPRKKRHVIRIVASGESLKAAWCGLPLRLKPLHRFKR